MSTPSGTARPSLAPVLLGPSPGHAERARTLLARTHLGTLCTLAREPKGYPFGSVVCFGTAPDGDPLLLTSDLAEHTRNFREDERASLLVVEPGMADPLAAERVTLMGPVKAVPEEFRQEMLARYLRAVPSAERYAGFKDFHLFRLVVEEIRFVGGFGRMSWVGVEAWRTSEPDPLAGHEPGILQHMNEDHADAMLEMCRHFASVEGHSPKMLSVDRLGFEVAVETPEGRRRVRMPFRHAVTAVDQVRGEMVALVRAARGEQAP